MAIPFIIISEISKSALLGNCERVCCGVWIDCPKKDYFCFFIRERTKDIKTKLFLFIQFTHVMALIMVSMLSSVIPGQSGRVRISR